MRWSVGTVPVLLTLAVLNPVSAQSNASCISLAKSQTCGNFSGASVSTTLTADFPFLQFVSNVEEFDTQFMAYIKQDYAKKKYQETMQCANLDLANTSYLYAQFTTTVLCGQMIQESITPCGLSQANSPPVCASTCADFATSEEQIVMTPDYCGGDNSSITDNRISLIRADFTVCALPANSLSSSCISGLVNEPANCGYGTNLPQLCTYCGQTSPNATSFCCLSSNLTACKSINIPPTRSLPPLFTSTATATVTATSTSTPSKTGLPTGAIIGIAIGAAIAGLIIAAFLLFCCLRRRKNQTPPLRPKTSTVAMSCGPFPERNNGYETIDDDSRVRRMTALHTGGGILSSPEMTPPKRGRRIDNSSSSDNNALSSPEGGSPMMAGTLPPPPPRGTYSSSASPTRGEIGAGAAAAIGAAVASRGSGNGKRGSRTSTTLSTLSPGGTELSEAASVSVIADHYSTNAIVQQSDVVALWSYTPRLADEMGLERGDVVRIENLYDDGWGLGRKLKTKIWDLPEERSTERDSGIGTSHRASGSTTRRVSLEGRPQTSEKGKEKEISETSSVKAFPMVCVCHRDAWAEVVAREEEESTSPTPEHGRRTSPTRLDLGVTESTGRKETRFDPEDLGSNSPEYQAPSRSRSSSQASRFREHGV